MGRCIASSITSFPGIMWTIWNVGDYMTSVGGMFFACLMPNGQLGIYYGSDPDPGGNDVLLTTVGTPVGGEGIGLMFKYGELTSLGTGPGGWYVGKADLSDYTTLTIQDDGQLVIVNDTTQAVIWTSGVSDTLTGISNVSSMVFDLENANVLPGAPLSIYSLIVKNHLEDPEVSKVTAKGSVQETSSWENSFSAGTTIETNFKTGIPIIAEGEVKISVTASYTYTWGGSKTTTAEYEVEGDISLPGHSAAKVVLVVLESTITLPYSAIADLQFSNKGVLKHRKIRSIYTGLNSHDAQISYSPVPYSSSEQESSDMQMIPIPNCTITRLENV